MEYGDVPPSDVPGEQAAPTQVLPDAAAAVHAAAVHGRPDHEAHARSRAGRARGVAQRSESAASSIRRARRARSSFPGMDGGGEWGGVGVRPGLRPDVRQRQRDGVAREAGRAEDARRQTHERQGAVPAVLRGCHRADLKGNPPEFPSLVGIGARRNVDEISAKVREGGGRMPAFGEMHSAIRRAIVRYILDGTSMTVRSDKPSPFDLKYSLDGDARFNDPDGFPAITPPWGTLTAIDLGKGAIPGRCRSARCPARGLTNSGSENYGGPVVTASGLVFIGATVYDNKFHAFDARTRPPPVGDHAAGGRQRHAGSVRGRRQGVRGHRRGRRQVGCPVRRHVRRLRATLVRDARSRRRRRRGVCGRRTAVADAFPTSSRERASARWRPPSPTRSRTAACCSPRPAPAPARRSPTSFPRSSAASASSSPPAPRTCRSRSSSRTFPRCARRSDMPFTATCMKGRGNYLCLHRLEQLRTGVPRSSAAFGGRGNEVTSDPAADHRRVGGAHRDRRPRRARRICRRICRSGTRSRRSPRPVSAPSARAIDDCFVTRMRQRAAESDLVIVNHHLLCADAAVRQSAYGEVIPACRRAILDEAHQLEDVATQYFGIASATTASRISRATSSRRGRRRGRPRSQRDEVAAGWPSVCDDRARGILRPSSTLAPSRRDRRGAGARHRRARWPTCSDAADER